MLAQNESGWPELRPPVAPLPHFTPSLAGFGALLAPTAGTATEAALRPVDGQEEPTSLNDPSDCCVPIHSSKEKYACPLPVGRARLALAVAELTYVLALAAVVSTNLSAHVVWKDACRAYALMHTSTLNTY